MSIRQPLRHHKAKIEYWACEEKIFLMLSKGYSRRLIHEELTEKKEMSMAYFTLCQFIRKAKKKGTALAKPQPPVPRPAQPNIIRAKPDGLQDPRTIDPSTII